MPVASSRYVRGAQPAAPSWTDQHEAHAVEYSARVIRQGSARSLGCAMLMPVATLAAGTARAAEAFVEPDAAGARVIQDGVRARR